MRVPIRTLALRRFHFCLRLSGELTHSTLLFQSPPEVDGTDTAVDGLEIFVRRPDGDAIAPDGSGDKGWWLPAPKPKGTGGGGSILVNGQ